MADPTQKLALTPSAAGVQISAAKLHVLHLAPIKEKLGAKCSPFPTCASPLQFKSHTAVPDRIDIRLGMAGIGCALPTRCDVPQAATIMKKLTHAFAEQRGFMFVEELDTPRWLVLRYPRVSASVSAKG